MATNRDDSESFGMLADANGPAFDHPWQAQVFSLTVHLHKTGLFSWADWVRIFSEEIKASPALPEESVNDTYYRQWLAAMEKLVAVLGFALRDDISRRTNEWRQAYLNTPHGQPVALVHATCPPSHVHFHTPRRAPVMVSPARAG